MENGKLQWQTERVQCESAVLTSGAHVEFAEWQYQQRSVRWPTDTATSAMDAHPRTTAVCCNPYHPPSSIVQRNVCDKNNNTTSIHCTSAHRLPRHERTALCAELPVVTNEVTVLVRTALVTHKLSHG